VFDGFINILEKICVTKKDVSSLLFVFGWGAICDKKKSDRITTQVPL